ncbi:MAG: hypothetical protein EBX35_05180, partial [Planctomycetia bacterium]|nr:hypothetical protein [Planctomycetia bacterium]
MSVNFASGTTTLDTNGNTVTLAGAVGYGSGAIQKTTAGTLVLAGSTTIANPFTGGTTISAGAIQLGNATALRFSTVTNSVANGLTFSSGVGSFTIGGLAGATNIALTDTAATAVQLRVGANNSNNTFTGVLSGSSGQFVKVGVGVQTFTTATQTYTGSTVITGGVSNTNLGNSGNGAISSSGIALTPTGASTNLLSASSPLQFGSTTADLPGGGTFTMTGPNSAVTNAQTFASTTVVAGYSATSLTSGNASNAVNLTLNALSRTAVTRGATTADAAAGGGTINFTALANAAAANQIATTTTTANDATGILGAWAYAGGTDYAAVNGSSQIIAYTGYTTVAGVTGAGSTTQNALFNTGASINTATVDYNTVKLGTATANFFATGTNTLRLGAVGGLLLPSGGAATTVGTAANNGILTAGGTTANNPGELIVFNGNAVTGNNLTLNSTITNNGTGAVTLVKTGSGQITLAGTNTFTGGTIVQQGRVQAAANTSAFGTGAVTILPGGQVYATGGTFANSFFIAGSGINENPNYGAIRLDGGPTVSGNVTLVGDAVIGTNSGTNVTGGTVSGAITGNFSLFKSAGQGRIILSGANTYTGATVAQIGVLQFGTGTASTQSFSSLAAQSVFVGGYPGGAATSGNTVFVNTSNAGDFQAFLATKANPASTGTFAFANSEAASNIDFAAAGLTNAWLMAGATTTYTGTFTPGSPGQFKFGGGDASGALTYQSTIGDYSPLARSSVTIGQTNTNTVGFTGSNTFSGGFSLSVGTYQLGSNLGQQFGSAAPGIAGVTMSGGTIQWRTATTVDLSGVTGGLTFTGGTFDTNGNSVTFATPINQGSTTLTRTGTGTFTLGSVAPIYGWTGNLTNSGGAGTILLNTATSVGPTAQLSIANVASNTIRLGTSLTAGAVTGGGATGGVLDLNGNVLTTGFSNAATTYTGQITSSSGTSTAALTKTGSGTFTWVPRTAAANYTGATTIRGGVLTLDIGNANAAVTTQPINVGSALVLGGGGLTLTGKASTTQTQAFASTTLSAGGANSVNVSGNNATANPLSVDLKALTRNVGATIDFVNPTNGTLATNNGITSSTLNGNFTAAGGSQSILGGYATVGGTNWAVTANSGTSNVITALATSNAGFAAGTNVDAPIGASAPGALAVNSLRFNTAGAATVDATGGLTIASGGVLVTSTVGTANGVTFTNGTLATGNGADLVIINNNGTAATGAVTVNSQITGGSGVALTKSGGGYLVLGNAANDYGATYLNAGIIQVSAPGNLGSGPVVISNNAAVAGTRLEFTAGGFTATNAITINNTTPLAAGGVGLVHYTGPAGQFVTLSGAITLNQLTAAGGHIGSATTTGGFIINGPITAPYGVTVQMRNGTNTLAGGGSYFAMNVNDTVRVGAADGISTTAVVNVAGSQASTVDLNGFNQTLEGLTQTASNAATVTNTSLTPATLTLNPASAWETYNYGSQATAGTIAGNVNIVKTGQGTQTIAGPITTTGGVTVSAGTLVLSAANSFTGAVTVTGGTLRVANARALGLTTGWGSGTVVVNGGSLDLNGTANVAAGAFSGSGGVVTDTSYGTGTSVFSMASNSSGSFAGSINDFTGNAFNKSMAFTKDGTGTLTLTGASTYTGQTTVFGGALNVRNAAGLGASTTGTTVLSGAAVELQGGITTAEPFTIDGTGIAAGGAIRGIAGTNTISGPITLSNAARVNADADSLTLGGAINLGGTTLTLGGSGDLAVTGGIAAGAGSVVKDGSGLATLSGANAYAGTTTVSAGTLRVASSSGLGTAAAGTTVGAAGITVTGESLVTPILQSVAGTNTWTGSITAQNQSTLTLRSDAGTLTISGTVDARSADATNQALVLTGAGGGTITQAIANPASVTKSGVGTWVLSGANTYASATAVTGGTLRAGGASTLSANSAVSLANASGAMLDLDGFANTIASLDGGGASG